MPYIDSSDRERVDSSINELVLCIKTTLLTAENANVFHIDKLSSEDVLKIAGVLNYCITRICSSCSGEVSYKKIALITGVLENVKQEFYRRIASPYEDKKIIENGDVREYKNI
jgi:hypothetical protein